MKKIRYFQLINFLSAFLLFQIELIIAKVFLPKFGGSYQVWGACMVFFQGVLLLGYFYSHLVVQKFGIYRYRPFHAILVILPLLSFSLMPLGDILPYSHLPLVIDIFLKLFLSIGLVFFVLSTVSIISQSWLAASELPEALNPYTLYAVSNLGSFLALFSYPFLFEAFFDLNLQIGIWRSIYFIFALLYLFTFKSVRCAKVLPKAAGFFNLSRLLGQFKFSDSLREKLSWFLFALAAAMLFLSVTNILCYEVAPCPLIWIIPLGIYLISFTLTFKKDPFCPSWIKDKIHLTLGFSAAFFFLTQARALPMLITAAIYFISLFAICMFCQYQLYIRRPQDKEGGALSGFYLIIALGSFIGSIIVTWLAPLVFVAAPLEYLAGLLAVALALVIEKKKPAFSIAELRWVIYAALLLVLWPRFFKSYNIFGLLMLYFVFKIVFGQLREKPWLVCLSLFSIILVALFTISLWTRKGRQVYTLRNYYGIYNVAARNGLLTFYSADTIHGSQFLAKTQENEPLSYFHRQTPVGKLLESKDFNLQRIAVIGLGAGVLAAYGRPGQQIDFFELDRDVYKVTDLCFTYLNNSAAKINYIFGDARITLSKAPYQYYDLLIIDAFSGDAVPVHLLTQEAIGQYRKHLNASGIILFHISNRYLDLAPVLFSNSRIVNASVSLNSNPHKNSVYLGSIWVAMTWDKASDNILSGRLGWKKEGVDLRLKRVRPWTDAYSNIPSIFAIDGIIGELRNFRPFDW